MNLGNARNARKQSFRAAFLLVGAAVAGGMTNGCSTRSAAPEPVAQSTSALDIACPACIGIRQLVPTITQRTSQPVANPAVTCGASPVPIPAALEGYGCTYGVAIYGDPNLLPIGTGAAYAWACPTSLPSSVLADGLLGTFGGPEDGKTAVVNVAATTDSCYGTPDAGYEIVAEFGTSQCTATSISLGELLALGVEGAEAARKKKVDALVDRYGDRDGLTPHTLLDLAINPLVAACEGEKCDCPNPPGGVLLQ